MYVPFHRQALTQVPIADTYLCTYLFSTDVLITGSTGGPRCSKVYLDTYCTYLPTYMQVLKEGGPSLFLAFYLESADGLVAYCLHTY